MNRFQFVADHRHAFEVKRLCEVLDVARSSFYAWLNAEPARTARQAGDAALAARIRTIHATDRALGAPRITAELNPPTRHAHNPHSSTEISTMTRRIWQGLVPPTRANQPP